jgi:uncharacterized Rmd1/YagE family protein
MAFSTADSYKFPELTHHLTTIGFLQPFIADDVLHWRPGTPSSVRLLSLPPSDAEADVFFFEDGTFVTWGASEQLHALLLKQTKRFEISSILGSYSVETEYFDFALDESR